MKRVCNIMKIMFKKLWYVQIGQIGSLNPINLTGFFEAHRKKDIQFSEMTKYQMH